LISVDHFARKPGSERRGRLLTLDADRSLYGISGRIDIQRYLRSRQLTIPPGTFPDVANLLIQFYGYDKIIRQDELSHGVPIASRFLQPSITQEEKILNPVCDRIFVNRWLPNCVLLIEASDSTERRFQARSPTP